MQPQQYPTLARCLLECLSSSGHRTLKKGKDESELGGEQHELSDARKTLTTEKGCNNQGCLG